MVHDDELALQYILLMQLIKDFSDVFWDCTELEAIIGEGKFVRRNREERGDLVAGFKVKNLLKAGRPTQLKQYPFYCTSSMCICHHTLCH